MREAVGLKGWLKPLVLIVAVAAVSGSGAAAAGRVGPSDARSVGLQRYLASMSWPVRASVLRAGSTRGAIDDWLTIGDPPFLGQIAGRCGSFLAIEARGHLLEIRAPGGLEAHHDRVVGAYTLARRGCAAVRASALAVRSLGERLAVTGSAADKRAWLGAEAAARTRFQQFERLTLASFTEAVRGWRVAVLRASAGSSVRSAWLSELALEDG